MAEQLSFLAESQGTETQFEKELKETKEQLDNVRKGLFKRYAELLKEFKHMKEDMSKIREFVDMKELCDDAIDIRKVAAG